MNTTQQQIENLQARQSELSDQIDDMQNQLDKMKHDPMVCDEIASQIESDHDDMLRELYAHVLDQLPFYICGRSASSFADFVKDCDNSFYSQSLNDYADQYDVESTDEYKELESELNDLQSELDQVESDLWDLENQDNDE